ncbi:hypothetical protein [Flindersiella endophytica]
MAKDSVTITLNVVVENVDPQGPTPVAGEELYEAIKAALLDESPEIRGEDGDEEYYISKVERVTVAT